MKEECNSSLPISAQVAAWLRDIEQHQRDVLSEWHRHEATWAVSLPELLGVVQVPGKRIRPRLFLLILGLCGGGYGAAARDVAAALELYHGVTLMYDDIQDNAQTRRGEPAHYTTYGVSATMSLCVILERQVNRMLLESSALERPVCLELIRRLNEMHLEMGVGQMAETAWVRDGVLDIAGDLYWRMVASKTGALFAFAAETGAFLAGLPEAHQAQFRRFGERLGVLFQVVDDFADIFLPDTDGKPRRQDLREAKRTLFLLEVRRVLPEAERAELDRLFLQARRTEADVAWLAARVATSGIRAEGERVIQRQAADVRAELERLVGLVIGEADANERGRRGQFAVALRELVMDVCRGNG